MKRFITALTLTAAATAPAFASPALDGTVLSSKGSVATVSLHPSERGIGDSGIVQARGGMLKELPAGWVLDPRDRGKVNGDTVTVNAFAGNANVQDYGTR